MSVASLREQRAAFPGREGEGTDVRSASIAEPQLGADRARSGSFAFWAIVGAITLAALQALAAARLELTFDEAYYSLWSHSLAFGYLDHPPMVALLVRASTAVFGRSELGVRALPLICVAALPGLIAWIAWRLFRSAETAALAALMWIAMPLVIAGGIFVAPDGPLTIFWTLGLAALVELWLSGRSRWLIALGLTLGLALESKFTAAFFACGVALAFMTAPSLRRWLVSPVSIVALLLALALFAPFVAWNAEHGWATFAKQGGRAAAQDFAPYYLGEFAIAQIGLMNPLVFAPFLAAALAIPWRTPPRPRSPDEARRILLSTIAPALCYFAIHALHDRVQGNWLAPLFPAAAILAADWVAGARQASGLRGFVARASLWAAPLAFAAMTLIFVQAMTGLAPLGPIDPTVRFGGYRDLARDVEARARAEGADFVIAQGYALTSLMTVYGDPAIPVVQPEQRIRWIFAPAPPESLFAAPGLAIGEADRRFDLILKMRFRDVEPAGRIDRTRGGRTVQSYDLFRVADPFAPVLDPPCPSAEVDLQRKCRP
jgi:Dolichyl-phosphate-mannose-protein mannosyltransferase